MELQSEGCHDRGCLQNAVGQINPSGNLIEKKGVVVFPGMAEKYISKYKYSGMADKVYSAVFPLTLSFTQISNLLTHTN